MLRTLVVLFGALALPSTAAAYPWPLKPFQRPHTIRAYFDDPRREFDGDEIQSAFHFGIDIVARDGAPVYAVAPGVVTRYASHVTETSDDHDFGYWHVAPVVDSGQVVEQGTLLGTVEPGWGHVHFAESANGVYVNPLRPDALAPYSDATSPTIEAIGISYAGKPVDLTKVHGTVDLTCDAFDTPPIAPPRPWQYTRVTPALIRWRILRGITGGQAPWKTAVDFRLSLMPSALFNLIYAPGTLQNRAGRPGNYNFFLRQAWRTTTLRDGPYRLQVAAFDTRGNNAHSTLAFTVANGRR
ncbi:MAG TPA: M23 family metallopeptidase [Gaiellaceae bacterium]